MRHLSLKDKSVRIYIVSIVAFSLLCFLFATTVTQRVRESHYQQLLTLYEKNVLESLRIKAVQTKVGLDNMLKGKIVLPAFEKNTEKGAMELIEKELMDVSLENLFIFNEENKIIFQKKAEIDESLNTMFAEDAIGQMKKVKMFIKFQKDKIHIVYIFPTRSEFHFSAKSYTFVGVSSLDVDEVRSLESKLEAYLGINKENRALIDIAPLNINGDNISEIKFPIKDILKKRVNLIEKLQVYFPKIELESDFNRSNGVIDLALVPKADNQPDEVITFVYYFVGIFLIVGIGSMSFLFTKFYFDSYKPFVAIKKVIQQINQDRKFDQELKLSGGKVMTDFSNDVNKLLKKVSKSFSILEKINSLEKEMSHYFETQDLCILVAHNVLKVIEVENVAVLVKGKTGDFFGYMKGVNQNKKGKELYNLTLKYPLSKSFNDNQATFIRVDQSMVYPGGFYISSGSDVNSYPLFFGGETHGLICIWNEANQLLMEEDELFFLKALMTATSSQLENIKLVSKIEEKARFEEEVKTERRISTLKAEHERLRQLGSLAVRMGDKVNTPLQVLTIVNEELREILEEDAKGTSEVLQLILKSQSSIERISEQFEELKKYRKYSSEVDLSDDLLSDEDALSEDYKQVG